VSKVKIKTAKRRQKMMKPTKKLRQSKIKL